MTDVVTVQEPQSLNLHQKLACMIGEVHLAKPKPSGKNLLGVQAFSIEDVENLLSPLLAQYRVTIEPSMVGLSQVAGPQTRDGRSQVLWEAHMDFIVRDSDSPEDMFTGQWMDIGGNPAAAVAFCAKAYYKRLFHIADAEEDGFKPELQTSRGSGQRTAASQRVDASPMPDGRGATPSEPEPTPPKGRNVIALKRPAVVDPDQRAECLHMAIEAAKMGLLTNDNPPSDEAEALRLARVYLDAMAKKNYGVEFLGCKPVQIAGIQSLISTKLARTRA